jgi:hypothetical protein
MENKDLGHSDSLVIHVKTVRRPRNFDYIMGELYDLVNTAKATFPGSRLVLSGVVRSKGVKWRRVGSLNDRLEWVARTLGATFVAGFRTRTCRDELYLSRYGARQLGDFYSRVCGINN